MQTSIKQCLVNRRLSSGKTQLKQTQFHLSSPFNRLRLESHSFSQDHNELEHLYKCSSLILWSDLATSPSGFPTTLPLIQVSPETLAFWPWCMPAVFPRQMFCFPVSRFCRKEMLQLCSNTPSSLSALTSAPVTQGICLRTHLVSLWKPRCWWPQLQLPAAHSEPKEKWGAAFCCCSQGDETSKVQ